MSDRKQAVELDGNDIDAVVRFPWRWDSGVKATVTGTVREVHHQPDEVTVWLADPIAPTGEKTEFVIDTRIWIEFPEDK